jgi:uncharacterized protein YdhG (YjbR/CyaY superfamily)
LQFTGDSHTKEIMPAKPKTIDDYLARVSFAQRVALEKLRRDIKTAAPAAAECISYDIPGYRLGSRLLVSFGAAKNHCAFYPGSVVQALKDELKDYDTSKGTIRFPADKPLPAALVRKLVKLRIANNTG